jgi:hypothetical protein
MSHLHLELEPKSDSETHLRGLFAPVPTICSFFIFLPFIMVTLFFIFEVISYCDYVLKKPLIFDISIMLLMTVFWFSLRYLVTPPKEGRHQLKELGSYFTTIINS